jgi:hypothetical protein
MLSTHMPFEHFWPPMQSVSWQHWRHEVPHSFWPLAQQALGSDWHLPAFAVPLGQTMAPVAHSQTLVVVLQTRLGSVALQSPSAQQPLEATHFIDEAQNLGVVPPQQPSVAGSVHFVWAMHQVLGGSQQPSSVAAHLGGVVPGQLTLQAHWLVVVLQTLVPSELQSVSMQQPVSGTHLPPAQAFSPGQQPALMHDPSPQRRWPPQHIVFGMHEPSGHLVWPEQH